MVHPRDAHGSYRSALKAAHQHSTQGSTQGGGLAAIERTNHEYPNLGTVFADLIVDAVNLKLQHGR